MYFAENVYLTGNIESRQRCSSL